MQNSSSLLKVYFAPRVCRGPLQFGKRGLCREGEVKHTPCCTELYSRICHLNTRYTAGTQYTFAQYVSLVTSESTSGIERWERTLRMGLQPPH